MRKFLIDWLAMFAACMIFIGVCVGGYYLLAWLFLKFGFMSTVLACVVIFICTAYAAGETK